MFLVRWSGADDSYIYPPFSPFVGVCVRVSSTSAVFKLAFGSLPLGLPFVSVPLGLFIVSLPLVSLLAMIWLWNDTQDTARIADHAQATFWYVLPSMPMFLVLPWLLRAGYGFWPSLAGVCLMTIALYALMVWALARFGITL